MLFSDPLGTDDIQLYTGIQRDIAAAGTSVLANCLLMVKINLKTPFTVSILSFQGEGQTALHIASAEGDEALVKYFYGAKANASITDHQGNTLRK